MLFDGVLQGEYRWHPGYVSSRPAAAAAGVTVGSRSFFHLMALWVFKWAGWSNAGYLLGAQCCYLTHNE
jgi:hypothetical protein